ncbi:hypothetical protein H072_7112 [Dactylellina haptotyla CBS 200.50]|uniref:Peptidase A1 domain-containing protein n=1 Tax=Dactylellina haptotyla (strain CBS 200.50) TaxID=1284197 RepID=S8A7X3_DACHA|nr:hypothetical protein H072_7112 [Dactylellina haptotyla CBS 200.50]
MLSLALAYATLVASAGLVHGQVPQPPPPPLRYAIEAAREISPNAKSQNLRANMGNPKLRRRQMSSPKSMIGFEDIEAMMAPQYFQPGKIPIMLDYTAISPTLAKKSWIASVNVTGDTYKLVVDNMLSDTWLYQPSDPNKCGVEIGITGLDYCYMDKMNMSYHVKDVKPFFVNYTGPGEYGVSGFDVVVSNISSSIDKSHMASFPAIIDIVDNVYSWDGSSPSPMDRLYHGVLGLGKKNAGQVSFQVGQNPMQYAQTPFHDKSGWSYYTTYFNAMDDPENMYIGLQYTDDAMHAPNMTTIPVSAGADGWVVDADKSWKVKYWENVNLGTADEATPQMFNIPFPAMNMSQTKNIKLDLGTAITYLDLDTVRKIYELFDGSCYVPLSNRTMDAEHGPFCKLPVTVTWDNVTDQQEAIPSKSPLPKFSLPWGPNADIEIDYKSLVGELVGPPCAGPNSMPMDMDTKSCPGMAYGTIQPNVYMNMGVENTGYWIYGGVVYQNAFFKWDTMNNGEVSVASYAMMGNQAGISSPSSRPNKFGKNKKKRISYAKKLPSYPKFLDNIRIGAIPNS